MAVEPKDLGLVSAYGAALEGGYTGTYDEYKEKMLDLLNLNLSSLGSEYDDTEIRNRILNIENAGYQTEGQVQSTVASEVAKVVANAPEDYDTLKEIANYIESDKTNVASIVSDISNLKSEKMDKVTLAKVATSGSYNDLSNKPTIPTGGVTGVKGGKESSYRTGNVNISLSNLGLSNTTKYLLDDWKTIATNKKIGDVITYSDNGLTYHDVLVVFRVYGNDLNYISRVYPLRALALERGIIEYTMSEFMYVGTDSSSFVISSFECEVTMDSGKYNLTFKPKTANILRFGVNNDSSPYYALEDRSTQPERYQPMFDFYVRDSKDYKIVLAN